MRRYYISQRLLHYVFKHMLVNWRQIPQVEMADGAATIGSTGLTSGHGTEPY